MTQKRRVAIDCEGDIFRHIVTEQRAKMNEDHMPFYRLRLNDGGATFQSCYGIRVVRDTQANTTLPHGRNIIARGVLPRAGEGVETVQVRAVDHRDRYRHGFAISHEVTLRRDVLETLCAGSPFQDLQATPFITITALVFLTAENLDHGEVTRRAYAGMFDGE